MSEGTFRNEKTRLSWYLVDKIVIMLDGFGIFLDVLEAVVSLIIR